MSDRRQFNGHRLAKQAFGGRYVSEAIRRAMRNEKPWPRATTPNPTPTTIPAPAPASAAGTTAQKEPT